MTDIGHLARRTVDHVMRLGPDHCDVLVVDTKHITAEIEKGSMKQASVVADPGAAVRAFYKGCSGFAFCTSHEMKAIKRITSLAVSQAKAGTHDPDFRGLPEKRRPAKVGSLFDRALSELEPHEAVEMAISLATLAGDDKRISSVNAGIGVASGKFALANSNGFCEVEEMTSIDVTAEAVARSRSGMFSGVDYGSSRRIESDMIERVGRNAREHAIMGLKQTRIETGDYPVVIDPLALGYILSVAIGEGANAEGVQRKRSYLAGKLGQSLGVPELTILDDPTIEWASGSYAFDGEGVPSRKKAIIDRGKLATYLYDTYTGGKDSVQSTGNSSRGGPQWSFRLPPSISSSNLVVGEGDASIEEMIAETKRGVYLRTTYDFPNLTTGEFSGLMMESMKIDRGELGPCLRQATIGVSIPDMLSRVDMIGRGSRFAFGVKTPALRISEAKIAGPS